MADPAYAVHPIPSVPSDHHIDRYRELRLQALQINPESFSSTYDRELLMGHEEWKARLHSSDKVTIVAVRASTQKSESEMLSSQNEWKYSLGRRKRGPELLHFCGGLGTSESQNEGFREEISRRWNGLGKDR